MAAETFFNCQLKENMFSFCSRLIFKRKRGGLTYEPLTTRQGLVTEERDMNNETINTDSQVTTKDAALPLKFEPDDYRHHVEEFDLTEEQRNDLLTSLWTIMSTLVDIGWGVDTVQILLPDIFAKVAPDSEKLLESKDTSQFESVTDTKKGQEE
ncbi:MAG: hypothetical protein KF888_04480 [Nitrosomonas sp.]|nr:hypothetical protein [Nitrosomonas sp.]